MKLPSPSSFQFIAAAASSDATSIMSSRPPYRGGGTQWPRTFSDRSSDRQNQYVTGDSHFRSGRDANRGPNHGGSYRPPLNPRAPPFTPHHFDPNFYKNQLFRPPPPPRPSPHVNQNQQFRPQQQFRPRPLDYRNWESAKQGPPPHCERFTVLSYNILADYLAINHRSKLYFHIPRHILDWEWRKRSIIFELGLWSPDILCFQEVDKFQDLEEELKLRGYSGFWKMRTGEPVDGCAIFWRVSRFKLLHEEFIEFNKLGLRDNVAQICVLELMKQNDNHSASARAESSGSNRVVMCNIHVLYNPKRGEIKLGQIRVLLDRAHAISKLWNDAPVVLCGDFNCTPKSPLYNFISEQKLDLSELPRDKISGQASAMIGPPRPFISNFRARSANNSVQTSAMVDDKESRQNDSPVEMQKQNDSPVEMQKQNELGCSSENVPVTSSRLSQPECINTVLDVSVGSCINRVYENENSALYNEPKKEIHQGRQSCKDETESALNVSASGLKKSPISYHDVGQCSVDSGRNGVDEFTPLDSPREDVPPDETAVESTVDIYATSNASCNSSCEHSLSNLRIENVNLKSEKGKLSFEGGYYSADVIGHPEPVCTSNSDVSMSKVLHKTSFPTVLEDYPTGHSGNLSSFPEITDKTCCSTSSEDDIMYKSMSIDSVVDQKMENLSLSEVVEGAESDGTLGEDYTTFLSELHNTDGGFPLGLGQLPRSDLVGCNRSSDECPVLSGGEVLDDSPGMDCEPFNMEKTRYDPSAWTPMEIETATGCSESTLVEHPLMLRSTYSEVELKDFSGTRDSNGEPLVTSYNRCFFGTVDYIWRSEGLQTARVLGPIPKHAMEWTPGFPTKKWGSDHIALVSELAFTKD